MFSVWVKKFEHRGNGQCPFPLFCILALAVAACGCGSRPQLRDGAEVITTSDGVRLSAHHYLPVGENPPGLVLVHRAGGDQHVWDGFAIQAQQWGYLVITMDLRGHGGSVESGGGALDFHRFSDGDWQGVMFDIDAALTRLLALGAAPEDLFIAGEAFGANAALQYTIEHEDVQGVVMLSPGAEYRGIKAGPLMEQLKTRPSLLLWCERDDYSASSSSALARQAPGHVETRVYPGSYLGADIFTGATEAMGQVLVWLDQMGAKPTG